MPAPIPAWPGEFVSLDGDGEVFVRTAPARTVAQAEPVLCVHGFGGSSTNWTDLMYLLSGSAADGATADGATAGGASAGGASAGGAAGDLTPEPVFTCDALDLPGFGYSPPSHESCSVSGQAATVIAFIEQRGRGPVHLIGNSLGGAVCTRVAATRPDLVKSLALVAPAMPDLWPRPTLARFPALCVPGVGGWLLSRVQKMPPRQRVELSVATIYHDGACVHPDRIVADIAEIERRDQLTYGDAVLLRCARSIVAEYLRRGPRSLWRDAARVSAPSLVIYGSHDRIVDPRMAGRAARAFRGGRVIVLPRTGHVAQMERPAAVAAEFRRMLTSPTYAYDGFWENEKGHSFSENNRDPVSPTGLG